MRNGKSISPSKHTLITGVLKKAESIGVEDNYLGSDEYKLMSEELKNLCAENGLPDLSKNIEMVLTYILFPNIALTFFKSLDL